MPPLPPLRKQERCGVGAADGDVSRGRVRAEPEQSQSRAELCSVEQRSVPATVASILAWPLGIVSGQTRLTAGRGR